jgi:hypothetical protein
LAHDLVPELAAYRRGRLQPELDELLRRPAHFCYHLRRGFAFIVRWFGHEEPPVEPDERCRTLCDDGWRAEGADDDPVKCCSMKRVAAGDLGPLVNETDAPLKPNPLHGPLEKLGAALIGLQQDHDHIRAFRSDDQAGQPPAGSQVKEVNRVRAQLAADHRGEPLGVAEVRFDRSGPQEAGLSSGQKHLVESREAWSLVVGVRHRRPPVSQPGR